MLAYTNQLLGPDKSSHWRFKPGVFAGMESVFDSGLTLGAKVGVEGPIEIGKANAYEESIVPLLVFSLGFAI